jgi:hypothetical protein
MERLAGKVIFSASEEFERGFGVSRMLRFGGSSHV